MNFNDMFPSQYFKAADVTTPLRLVIENVDMADLLDGKRKPCLWFAGQEKGLIINITNGLVLKDGYGPDSLGWLGKPVELHCVSTLFKGAPVPSIRVRVPVRASGKQPQAAVWDDSDPEFLT